MFQGLRVGSSLFLLNKESATLEQGEITSISQPHQEPFNQFNNVYQPPKMSVDIKVRVGERELDLQKLPADADSADFGAAMVVSTNRESMLPEVESLRKKSERVLESVDAHKLIVERCAMLEGELNPQRKADAERAAEIEGIRNELAELKGLLSQALSNKKEK